MEHVSGPINGDSRPTSSNSFPNLLPKSSPVTFSHTLSVRLDEHNYLPWKHQVFAAIKGSRLQRFLDPLLMPPMYLSDDDRLAQRLNPDYDDWDQQDSILVSWLLSSMTEKILTRMVGCNTAAQIWRTLQDYFTALNRANIVQYKTLLRNTRMKGSLGDYLLKIKSLVETLSSIGHTLTEQDHIEAIFNGLSPDYEVFITSVTDTYRVAEIEALLLAQEAQRLEKASQDWESALALVESPSNPSNLAGGFGGFDAMYDQGAVRQLSGGGSPSSVALPGPPVLALPAPDGTLQADPFAASLVVPPPLFVQIADMDRKHHFLVQEQQQWQQYAREGMQGQLGLAKITGGYGPNLHQTMPYGMGQPGGYYHYHAPY